jgi:hypothetical protein
MGSHDNTKEIVTLRVARRDMDTVRDIAAREDESQSAVIRRLLRAGLRFGPEHAMRGTHAIETR